MRTLPLLNPIALSKAKIICNFGLSECNRVKSAKEKKNSGDKIYVCKFSNTCMFIEAIYYIKDSKSAD